MLTNVAGISAPKDCSSARKHVPLDDVERFASVVEFQASLVEAFCDRFFSGSGCGTEGELRAIPSGYNGQLQRLGGACDALANAVSRLSEIG
jgi:hypothetical protein